MKNSDADFDRLKAAIGEVILRTPADVLLEEARKDGQDVDAAIRRMRAARRRGIKQAFYKDCHSHLGAILYSKYSLVYFYVYMLLNIAVIEPINYGRRITFQENRFNIISFRMRVLWAVASIALGIIGTFNFIDRKFNPPKLTIVVADIDSEYAEDLLEQNDLNIRMELNSAMFDTSARVSVMDTAPKFVKDIALSVYPFGSSAFRKTTVNNLGVVGDVIGSYNPFLYNLNEVNSIEYKYAQSYMETSRKFTGYRSVSENTKWPLLDLRGGAMRTGRSSAHN